MLIEQYLQATANQASVEPGKFTERAGTRGKGASGSALTSLRRFVHREA